MWLFGRLVAVVFTPFLLLGLLGALAFFNTSDWWELVKFVWQHAYLGRNL